MLGARMLRPRKYKNTKVEVDGLKFDSKKEARRYEELKLLQRSGEIAQLSLQTRIPLSVNGHKVCTYVADFTYTDVASRRYVVEDVKSEYTKKLPLYRLKRKLHKAIYGFDITEV